MILVALLSGSVITAANARDGPVPTFSLKEGIDAYVAGAPLQALAVFVRVARAEPASALPVIWAGIAATAAGRNEEAEAYFREALRRPHSDFEDRITQGWLRRLAVLREPPPIMRATPSEMAQEAIAALARASNPRLTPEQAIWIGAHVVAAAQKQQLDPWLLAAVVYIESRFNHRSRSRAGATGLGQLMPHTARAAGVNPKDPWGNLLGAAMMLRGYYLKFRDWRLALAAYNAGEAAVRRYHGVPPYAETRWYVSAVWTVYQKIRPNV